jgi:hypothetical protein
MSAEWTVTFPIANRMFGVDNLATRLNALASDGQISAWHPGRWIDWGHAAIQIIRFDSVEDVALARKLCQGDAVGLPSRELAQTAKRNKCG